MGLSTKNELRDQQLNLSLTKGELERVRQRAETAGMRVVHFARMIVLDENRRPTMKSDTEHSATRLLYLQLARLGNNLNQLVRHMHRHGGPIPRELDPLLHEIRRHITRNMPQ
jgi:hypothetical protein